MIRIPFIIISIALLSASCKPRATGTGLTSFGNGDQILHDLFDKALTGYDLEHTDFSWSGVGGSKGFSTHDYLIVKNSDIKSIANKLDAELDTIPTKRSWSSHGSGRTGDRFLRISYEEDDAQFYMDFILTQKDKDVEVYVLYKGIKL